jgi:hypothetical protein
MGASGRLRLKIGVAPHTDASRGGYACAFGFAANAAQAGRLKARRGPSGSLESRMATTGPTFAASTQLPPLPLL